MTYDIVMDDPHRNFLANDFVVHNSGKSYLLSCVYPAFRLGTDPAHTILGSLRGRTAHARLSSHRSGMGRAFRALAHDVPESPA